MMKDHLLKSFLIIGIFVLSAQLFLGRVEAKAHTSDNADGYKAKTYQLAQENQQLLRQIAADQKELKKLVEENNVLLRKIDERLGGK